MRKFLVFFRKCVLIFIILAAGLPSLEAQAAGVVGNGTPESCTEAALIAALAGGGTVTFNCGGPTTIFITTPKVIAADTTIIGDDVITLAGEGSTRLFEVNSGVTLRLQHIVLDGGASTDSDGGAIASAGALYLELSLIHI